MNIAEQPVETKSLYMERTFNTNCEEMFKAWTDPNILMKWFAPEDVTTVSADVDLQVGGDYKIVMQLPDGELAEHYGSYKEIIPSEKLVFTWILDGEGCAGQSAEKSETLVIVEFKAVGDKTEVRLTHDFFITEKAKDMHAFGWNGCLDSLGRLVA